MSGGIVHQIWMGPNARPEALEAEVWRAAGGAWMLWDDVACRGMLGRGARLVFDRYLRAGLYHGAADVARYVILRELGGLYIDADATFEGMPPIGDEGEGPFLVFENEVVVPGLICNGVMYFPEAGHHFLEVLVAKIEHRLPFGDPWRLVGPQLVTETYRELMPQDVRVLPARTFLPVHHTGAAAPGTAAVYSRHGWTTTKKRVV